MIEELKIARQRIAEATEIIDRVLGTGRAASSFQDGGGARQVERNGKNYIEIANRAWFIETCAMLKVHPHAEPRDAEAFESLPSGLNKFGSLTEGQWKLFKALHKKILGTWPEIPSEAKAPVTPMTAEDLSSIPF